MIDTPLVSVVLPFYNAPFLKEAIESILKQSYQNFELIIVNNASIDSSSEVARSYTNYDKVILINEAERGVVHAVNTGIRNAKGTYIARMDADDIADPNRLKYQVEAMLNDSSLDVVSGLVEYLGSSENEGFIHYVDWLNTIRSNEELNQNQFVEFPLANPSMMLKRELFEQFGYYKDGNFPEDYEFFLRLQSHDVKMEKVNKPVLKWRDSETRLTRTDERYSQEAFFKIKAKYLAKWLKMHNPFHPEIYIWGAGRLSRRRSDLLLKEGIKVVEYIDVKAGNQVLHYENLPEKKNTFIVSYVSNRGAREEIRSFLIQKGYIEGVNFILAA
ncbi:glycosyltransferase [Ekhidna sp.]|uniref:glycosyltransferase family 2 protein n=1 Tax=Ekhidna sp. TaxID=2608089 RepID=UPI0032EC9D06